jgi:hypothetical protein
MKKKKVIPVNAGAVGAFCVRCKKRINKKSVIIFGTNEAYQKYKGICKICATPEEMAEIKADLKKVGV